MLTFPWRRRLAQDSALLGALTRIFVDTVLGCRQTAQQGQRVHVHGDRPVGERLLQGAADQTVGAQLHPVLPDRGTQHVTQQRLTLGLVPATCYLATGPKWADITSRSRFIREPGVLSAQVTSHLKIDTDERDSCRRTGKDGRCVEDDYVFSLREQRNRVVEAERDLRRVEVRAGHVEIVGDKRRAPAKLLAILQQHGVLRATPPDRASDLDRLLERVYGSGGSRGR